MKVLVCDDREKEGEEVRCAIEKTSGHETVLWSGRRLTKKIQLLFERAQSVLTPKFRTQISQNEASAFADFDVAILDNNLSALNIGGARHTAESIAGYVRAFGDIPYIVSLNKNPQVDFDLRYLVGDYQTHADLAVNGAHFRNRGLWTGDSNDAPDGFLPWYWPALNHAAERRRKQIQFVEERLDEPILGSMGLPASTSNLLSRHARGALSPEAELAARITFKKFFVTACRSLPIQKERKTLARELRREPARGVVARVVAGELDRWFRRDLLGHQDLLVDLPHLLMRMPFLLGSHAGDIRYWNEAVAAAEPPYGLSNGIYRRHLQGAKFVHADVWTKSPCFWWRILKSDVELNKMFFGSESQWADAVFCEDLSRFKSVDPRKRTPREFVTEFEGTWNRRHVACLKGKHYMPKSRLAR